MNRTLLATTLALSLSFGASAFAQAPVGGPDAKGNAPLKHAHTIDDGSAKPGANSFTEGQARKHILNSGYTDVSGLAKGPDGVWRGMATRDGAQVSVAMDFKGNVTQAAASGGVSGDAVTSAGAGNPDATGASTDGAATTGAAVHHHRRHRRRHAHNHCANPGPNGVACSGVDTTGKGISDREQKALQAGAHP